MPDEQQINKWPDDYKEPRNQCVIDGCTNPASPHSPWCPKHWNETVWPERVAQLKAQKKGGRVS